MLGRARSFDASGRATWGDWDEATSEAAGPLVRDDSSRGAHASSGRLCRRCVHAVNAAAAASDNVWRQKAEKASVSTPRVTFRAARRPRPAETNKPSANADATDGIGNARTQ